LRWDKDFPVLHCGKAGDAWRFDLQAVVAHVGSSARRRGQPSGVPVPASSKESECALPIVNVVAELVVELRTLLERIDAVLGPESAAPTATVAREVLGGDSH